MKSVKDDAMNELWFLNAGSPLNPDMSLNFGCEPSVSVPVPVSFVCFISYIKRRPVACMYSLGIRNRPPYRNGFTQESSMTCSITLKNFAESTRNQTKAIGFSGFMFCTNTL